jgi:hypothetical protein
LGGATLKIKWGSGREAPPKPRRRRHTV